MRCSNEEMKGEGSEYGSSQICREPSLVGGGGSKFKVTQNVLIHILVLVSHFYVHSFNAKMN